MMQDDAPVNHAGFLVSQDLNCPEAGDQKLLPTGLSIGGHHHHRAPILGPDAAGMKVDSVENSPTLRWVYFQSCAKLTKISVVGLSHVFVPRNSDLLLI